MVWNIWNIFPYIWNNHPNWLSYFSEGQVYHQPDYICFEIWYDYQNTSKRIKPLWYFDTLNMFVQGGRALIWWVNRCVPWILPAGMILSCLGHLTNSSDCDVFGDFTEIGWIWYCSVWFSMWFNWFASLMWFDEVWWRLDGVFFSVKQRHAYSIKPPFDGGLMEFSWRFLASKDAKKTRSNLHQTSIMLYCIICINMHFLTSI